MQVPRLVRVSVAVVAIVGATFWFVATLAATEAKAWSACYARTAPVPQGTLTETAARATAQSGRLLTLTFEPPAMQGVGHGQTTQRVNVMLPQDYDSSGNTRYPVLYLLHGSLDDYTSWADTSKGNLLSLMGNRQMIVVMPNAGAMGGYTDWWGMTTSATANEAPPWETYHIKQLIPWVDANFPTRPNRDNRAVAGLSMGGAGASKYASKYPDLFGFLGTFSGANYINQSGYPATDLSNGNLASSLLNLPPNPACKWGSHDETQPNMEINWRRDDPTYNAENLESVDVYTTWGTGSDATENVVRPMSQAHATAMTSYGITHTVNTIAGGVHDWANWRTALTGFLGWLDGRIGTAPAIPVSFNYRTGEPQFNIHDWSFSSDRGDVREFTYLENVSESGFTAIGSGTLNVTTKTAFTPGNQYLVKVGAAAPTTRTADSNGRLSFPVDLGPAHTGNQMFPPSLAEFSPSENNPPADWVRRDVVIATPSGTNLIGTPVNTSNDQPASLTNPTNQNNNLNASFSFGSSDPASTFICKFNSAAERPCASPIQTGTGNQTGPTQTRLGTPVQGVNTFKVWSVDSLGGRDPVGVTYQYRYDTVNPIAAISGGPANGSVTNEKEATFSFSATNETFGSIRYLCQIDGGPQVECGSAAAGALAQRALENLIDGPHSFKVRAMDAAGNLGAEVSRNWSVDTVGPDVQITSGSTGLVSSSSATFEFEAAESESTYECRLDEGDWTGSCESPVTFSDLSDGSHSFSVRAIDHLGNPGLASSRSWTIDTTPPVVTITSGPEGSTREASAQFGFSSNEAGSTFSCRLDAGAPATCVSPKAFRGLATGAHTFGVVATDRAGNSSTEVTRAWTVESEQATPAKKPVITFIKGKISVSAKGKAGLGKVTCVNDGPCRVKVKSVTLKIGKKRHPATVAAPGSIPSGAGKAFTLTLSKKVFKALKKGKKGSLTLNLEASTSSGVRATARKVFNLKTGGK